MLVDLVFRYKGAHEKLALMSIHDQIKAARLAKGWSHAKLAEEVSKAEGREKYLAWQTVQQWEREGGTAPKRSRLETVARVLGCSVGELIGSTEATIPAEEAALLAAYRKLAPEVRSAVLRTAGVNVDEPSTQQQDSPQAGKYLTGKKDQASGRARKAR